MSKVREATHTVAFVDEYCAHFRTLFANVRHFEQFTALHLELLAETKRKSLPRLAKTAKTDAQALHHFLANAEWSVEDLRAKRMELLRAALAGQPFMLCIDETGDRKKGRTTDYVAHQYIGNIGGTGQRGGLGQCLRHPRRHPHSARLSGLQAQVPAQAGRRLLGRDYDYQVESSEALIYADMSRLMLRRMTCTTACSSLAG